MQYEYITTYGELDRLVSVLLQNPRDWLGCDTETTGLDCHTCKLSTVQLSSLKLKHTYVIDVVQIEGWTHLFQKLTAQRTYNWAFHNFKFDLKFFWKVGIDFHGCKVVDTMIVSGLLNAGLNLNNDLKSVAERYLGMEVDKTEQKSDWGRRPLTDEQVYYAAKDADTTRILGMKLTGLVKSENITEVFKLEMRALPSFASMEFYGTNLDLARLAELQPIYETKLNDSQTGFLDLVPGRFIRRDYAGKIVDHGLDLNSPSQVLEVLRKAGIPNPLYDVKGREPEQSDPLIMSTGGNTLKLLNVADYVLLENLLGYRKAAKLLYAYVYSLPGLVNTDTGRLHTHFRQSVSTGRASSSSPNLQNLSRPDGSELNLRSCFTPSEGYVLLDGDYSQIELRVVAEVIYNLSGDRKMLDEFIEGRDPYAATAALLSGMRYEDIVDEKHTILKQYKSLRQNAKAVRLGFNYSMGAPKFRTYAKITYGVSFTPEEALANRKLYFQAYPGLNVYHDTFKDKGIRTVHTLDPFKRPRHFDDYPGIPSLSNHPIQGSSADIQKLAMAMMYEKLYEKGYSPVHSNKMRQICTIHDEIVSEAIPDLAEECAAIQEYCMKGAAQLVLHHCPVEADVHAIANLAMK